MELKLLITVLAVKCAKWCLIVNEPYLGKTWENIRQ